MTDDEPTSTATRAEAPPRRRRAWPWVLVSVALVGVLALVGVGVFTLLDGALGGGDDVVEEGVYTEDGTLVEEPDVADGQVYGDNADLDALWDACEQGDGAACDELYVTSDLGSEYETFGQSCGGRLEGTEDRPASCTEVTG